MKSTTRNITMPRKTKRKSNLNQNVSDVIPYSKVRVEWIDILSDSGWADEKGFNKMKLAFPVNEGWLYNKDKYAVKLFASYDRDDDGSLTFGDRTMIPLACVKKMTKIQ
jgi:hypothetical protein